MSSITSHLLDAVLLRLSLSLLILAASASSPASDIINKGRNITDGETLVSAGGSFTLGFFPPGVPTKRYLGIWFSVSVDAVCWVANRDHPLTDTSGVLVGSDTGSLLLLDGSGQVVWSANTTGTAPAVTQLLESGNLVVRDPSNGTVLWQAFDHPSNTLLPGMRIGKNLRNGAEGYLSSWRSASDPSPGNFRYTTDTKGAVPQNVLFDGDKEIYRTGPWNGLWFSGVPEMATYSDMFTYQLTSSPDEITYGYVAKAGAPFSRLVLTDDGVVKRLVWDNSTGAWKNFFQGPRDICDNYGKCGAFGLCDANAPSTSFCSCVHGFSPASPAEWKMRDNSGGCRRDVALDCGNGTTTDGFLMVQGVKLPDTHNASVDSSITLEDCSARCLADCSCIAYAAADIRGQGGGSGCVIWRDGLRDLRYVDGGPDIYVRSAKSELVQKKRGLVKIALPVIAFLLIFTFIIGLVRICKYKGKQRKKEIQKRLMLEFFSAPNELAGKNIEFPFISFEDVIAATDNFCESNILGKGGFGKVYKGMLGGDKEVAIKRLSKGSGQGIEEFRNEVVLIAKLQHRNLVRLLGCCIHEDEKLLIYEYLHNKSLDSFLFDVSRNSTLDWTTRFKIIKGVARGLLYLHQDSRLTIIHRDLKASNILLDAEMNPKISDFGMARIFGGNKLQENTTRVVGTYGYMSPEYVMGGAFSVKSDTYSFGVLLLEIVSGLKISSPQLIKNFPSLIAYAWRLWKDGKATELVDSSVVESCPLHEVLRCIHVGLLCVQDHPDDRPLMSSAVFMLENESTLLPAPKQPVYFAPSTCGTDETRDARNMENSVNAMSITTLEGR